VVSTGPGLNRAGDCPTAECPAAREFWSSANSPNRRDWAWGELVVVVESGVSGGAPGRGERG
jgi:hypothetical protein